MPVSEGDNGPARVAIVLKGYPRLSETFIAQEIFGLEQAGLSVHIVSLRHPTDPARHKVHDRIRAGVTYLPEYLHHEPLRVARCLWRQIRRKAFRAMLGTWFSDLLREPTRNRFRRIGQALVMAEELPSGVRSIYAHFIHTPGSVARYAAGLTGLPFSLSAHAKDIWTTPDAEIREKLEDARWTVCCTRSYTEHLRKIADGARVELVYHGLDTEDLPRIERRHAFDGSASDQPCRILCVARAVEKKGIDVLLQALATLDPDLHWRFVHVGGGEKLVELQALADRLGIAGQIEWRGALPRDGVMSEMAASDIFCLPARVAADGDRDGLPNVLLEALCQEMAVVSTKVGGIAELVDDCRNGLLIESDDVAALAKALVRLIVDPALRARLGKEGRERVVRDFDAHSGIERIATLLRGMT
ncbi:MAG: glycosyltransferase family 4 protein [Geminicoccaceae bacterium]